MDISTAFQKYLQSVTTTSKAAGSYVNGIWVEGSETITVYSMAVIPMTPESIKYLPEGVYDTEDVSCYRKGVAVLTELDEVAIGGKDYFVKQVADRQHGNFTKYFCKRVVA